MIDQRISQDLGLAAAGSTVLPGAGHGPQLNLAQGLHAGVRDLRRRPSLGGLAAQAGEQQDPASDPPESMGLGGAGGQSHGQGALGPHHRRTARDWC